MTDEHDHDADCSEAIHALYEFIDGELTAERRVAIQAHLDGCHGCYEAFDFEAELRILISQRCRDEVPERLRHNIVRALESDANDGI